MDFVIQPNELRESVKRNVCAHIDALEADKPWLVTVSRLVKQRSGLQRKALWGVAYKVICDETGYKDQDLHVLLCGEYFGWQVKDMFGNKKRVPVRTTTQDEAGNRDVISRQECGKYYDFIQRFAAEYSVDVPDPDPAWRFKSKGDE